MQIGRKMTEFEAFEVLSVVLEHPVHLVVPWLLQAGEYNTFSSTMTTTGW